MISTYSSDRPSFSLIISLTEKPPESATTIWVSPALAKTTKLVDGLPVVVSVVVLVLTEVVVMVVAVEVVSVSELVVCVVAVVVSVRTLVVVKVELVVVTEVTV